MNDDFFGGKAEGKRDRGSTIHSDAFKSYNALWEKYDCDMQKYDPQSNDKRLKWPLVMISNVKANIEGAYHGLKGTYLQRYLDEFYYCFNRRHSGSQYLAICWHVVYGTL